MNQELIDSILTNETKKFLNALHEEFHDRIEFLLNKTSSRINGIDDLPTPLLPKIWVNFASDRSSSLLSP